MRLCFGWLCLLATTTMPIVAGWLMQCAPDWMPNDCIGASCMLLGLLLAMTGIVSIASHADAFN